MSIVVFWLAADGQPAQRSFDQHALLDALRFSEERRREGLRHVCISSELEHSVGQGGVSAVEDGRLPGGEKYDFDKSHRGAGPGIKKSRR